MVKVKLFYFPGVVSLMGFTTWMYNMHCTREGVCRKEKEMSGLEGLQVYGMGWRRRRMFILKTMKVYEGLRWACNTSLHFTMPKTRAVSKTQSLGSPKGKLWYHVSMTLLSLYSPCEDTHSSSRQTDFESLVLQLSPPSRTVL